MTTFATPSSAHQTLTASFAIWRHRSRLPPSLSPSPHRVRAYLLFIAYRMYFLVPNMHITRVEEDKTRNSLNTGSLKDGCPRVASISLPSLFRCSTAGKARRAIPVEPGTR
jgi:hypothetical protein